jgi:hypothetical protein
VRRLLIPIVTWWKSLDSYQLTDRYHLDHGRTTGDPQSMGAKAASPLKSMNVWLNAIDAVVMSVLILVIGFVLIGRGISGFN